MGTRFEDVHENIEAVFHLLECARLISPSPAKHLILHPAKILVWANGLHTLIKPFPEPI